MAPEPHRPYVPAEEQPAEFTAKAILVGIVFGVLFGAANAYLGLRAGLTISTSIPIAVMTVAAFRMAFRGSSILEANLSQTVGSASSSVASGVIFTLPALFLWDMAPGLVQMTLLGLCGGLLGVLFMIPLRRYLIAREHGNLPYPEGTACSQVLIASESGGDTARHVFVGLGVGALFKIVAGWIKIIPEKVSFAVPLLPKAELGSKLSGALLGVGYILGPRIAGIMVGGGLLSWLVIIPLIALFGEARPEPLYPETVRTIAEMGPSDLWTRYVRYIGAGAVATGGLITLIRSIPTMIESFRVGATQIKERIAGGTEALRTDRDLSLKQVGIGVGVVAATMAFVPTVFSAVDHPLHRIVAAVLVVIFAFFFVTVSSRIVGMVGVTSNPTSGMTIATLLATAAVFLGLGWSGDAGKAAALTVGCVVAIAASIAGDTSQDLKTGFLLGATPRRQQIGELVGVLSSAAFVCAAVIFLNEAYGFGSDELPAPQATLMKIVIEGVLDQSLPWGLVAVGAGIAVVAELVGVPSLPFAVGVYLPVSTMVPVFLGGAIRKVADAVAHTKEAREKSAQRGILFGSGLVGGEGLVGVGIAGAAFFTGAAPEGFGSDWAGGMAPWVGVGLYAVVAYGIWATARRSA